MRKCPSGTRLRLRSGSTNCLVSKTNPTSRHWRWSLETCPTPLLSHFANYLLTEYGPQAVAQALRRTANSSANSDEPVGLSIEERAEWFKGVLQRDPSQIMKRARLAPDPWQEQVLGSTTEQILLLCSRQVGKSTVAGALA